MSGSLLTKKGNKPKLGVPEQKGPAYMIPPWMYYVSTLALYGINILGAIFIHDVEIVIGFIGSVSCSLLNFFLPGMYYVMTARKETNGLKPSTLNLVCAALFATYGIAMGLLTTTLRIVALVQGEEV